MLKIQVAVPSNTEGCGWSTLVSVVLRIKDGGLLRVVTGECVNGGGGLLLVVGLWQKLARDSMEGFLELLDIL